MSWPGLNPLAPQPNSNSHSETRTSAEAAADQIRTVECRGRALDRTARLHPRVQTSSPRQSAFALSQESSHERDGLTYDELDETVDTRDRAAIIHCALPVLARDAFTVSDFP